jgi:hypothetical protein
MRGAKMNNETLFGRMTAVSTIISALLILAASVVLPMAIDFNFEFLSNPADLITAGLDADAVGLFRWGSILELLGYFVFLIPATLYLWYWLRPRNPTLASLATIFGLGSIFIGIIDAAIRAGFWPPMMNAYPQTAEAQREVLQVVFRSVTDFTFEGLYATDSILAGLWWVGIGLILRAERRVLGIATAIMGIAILGAGFGWMLGVDTLARLENVYFFQPFWAIWLAVAILRHGEQREPAFEPVTAG